MSALIKHEMEQGSPEWHQKRRTMRTASNAGTVMKCSPYSDWNKLAAFYNGNDEEISDFQKSIFQHGHDLEPVLREAFGNGFAPTVFEHGDYMASLDGWNGKDVLEIKAPATGKKSKTWKSASDGKIEPHYEWQIHHQLFVTGAEKAFFLVGVSADEYQVIEVARDEEKIKQLLAGWDAFFDWMITEYQAETVDERNDAEWQAAARAYVSAKLEADVCTAKMEEAKAALIGLSQAKKSHGAGVTVTKSFRKGAIDYAKVPQLKDVDLEPYRKKDTETTTITLEKEAA